MLELVRHGLRQWNERAGGGDPGGGAAEGGADAGEAAAEPRGAGRGAGQRGTGRAEQQSPAAGNARKEPERLGEGAPAPSSSSAAPRPPHPPPSAGPGLAGRSAALEGREAPAASRLYRLDAAGAAVRPTAGTQAGRGTVRPREPPQQ